MIPGYSCVARPPSYSCLKIRDFKLHAVQDDNAGCVSSWQLIPIIVIVYNDGSLNTATEAGYSMHTYQVAINFVEKGNCNKHT